MLNSRSPFERSPVGTVVSIVIALVFFYALFKVLGFVFSIIWYAAPIIFIASLVIDYKVSLGFLGQLKRLFQKNWIFGLAAGIASVVLFPLVALYLCGVAIFKKKLNERRQRMDEEVNGKWADFEEVDSKPMTLEIPYEELPPAPEPQARGGGKGDTKYDELFD